MVGVAGHWENDVLDGIAMGPEADKGLQLPSPFQLLAASAVLGRRWIQQGTMLTYRQTTVQGKKLIVTWPDERDVNGLHLELGEAVTFLEMAVLGELLLIMAKMAVESNMMQQTVQRQRQVARPSIVVPGGRVMQ